MDIDIDSGDSANSISILLADGIKRRRRGQSSESELHFDPLSSFHQPPALTVFNILVLAILYIWFLCIGSLPAHNFDVCVTSMKLKWNDMKHERTARGCFEEISQINLI